MKRPASHTLRHLATDERGTIAMIFSLCIFVLCSVTGLAIDVGRLYQATGRITNAADSAALAAAKSLRLANLDDAGVTNVARQLFDTDMLGPGGNYTAIDSFGVNINREAGSVEIAVVARVQTIFARIAGVENFNVPKSAVAVFDAKQTDIEVSLQLDLTGSMGGKKISDLRTATANLLDVLIPDNPTGQKVRVALAPFSAGVNAGVYLKAVDGNRSSPNNCTYERRASYNEKTDAAPIAADDTFKIKSDLTGAVQACPSTPVVPLTGNKSTLKTAVSTFNAVSSTAGQLGASWAWYLVSPNWSSVWPSSSEPSSYNDGKTIKTVILMTDGVYNTIGGINYGDSSTQAVQASKLSVDICNAMKAKGITVYTVGFDVANAGSQKQRVIDTLTACASDPSKFFLAEDGDALDASFRAISYEIVKLRLSK